MQEIQDLIPHYREIADLYQSEGFKPLAQFLSSTRKQVLASLLSIDWKKETAEVEAVQYTTQLNLLGIIAELPQMLKSLKDQFEANELRIQNLKKVVDPIYKGEY